MPLAIFAILLLADRSQILNEQFWMKFITIISYCFIDYVVLLDPTFIFVLKYCM